MSTCERPGCLNAEHHDLSGGDFSRVVVSVGLDGQSRPMYRYRVDLPLADHARRIVRLQDRPDYSPTTEAK